MSCAGQVWPTQDIGRVGRRKEGDVSGLGKLGIGQDCGRVTRGWKKGLDLALMLDPKPSLPQSGAAHFCASEIGGLDSNELIRAAAAAFPRVRGKVSPCPKVAQ